MGTTLRPARIRTDPRGVETITTHALEREHSELARRAHVRRLCGGVQAATPRALLVSARGGERGHFLRIEPVHAISICVWMQLDTLVTSAVSWVRRSPLSRMAAS